jgi:hypothetical protein
VSSDAVGSRDAVVIGMHRSGTSATANCLAELGLFAPPPGDLINGDLNNERGYWESDKLTKFDESVLRHLGGTWSAPPRLPDGWEASDDDEMRSLRSRAAELVGSIAAEPPRVMKDPRLCLTLPLWRRVLPREPVAVLVFRDPLEVALSLQKRNEFPLTLSLALWHRYVRQSLASLVGLPVLVIEYARVLDEPRLWVDDLVRFLNANGITPGADRSDRAAHVLQGELRHNRRSNSEGTLEAEQQPILEILRSRLGAHERWSEPELPPEPLWVSDVINLMWAGQAVTTAMQTAQNELKWLKRSRLFRATTALWRVTGRGPVLSAVEESSDAADPSANGADALSPTDS